MSSYRTELGGILAALYVITRICEYYNITQGKMTLYCDNKGAITNSFKTNTPTVSHFLSPSYDLLYSIKQLIAATPITIVGDWVKGHYSGKNRQIQHDLNDTAHQIAGEHLENQSLPDGTNGSTIPCPGYKV
jgi:hypothetical protein